MPQWGFLACCAGFCLGAASVVVAAKPLVRRGDRVFCPGPRPSALGILIPWRWLRRAGCGYNMSGAPPCAEGGMRCPECGTHHASPGALTRTANPWHFGRIGVALMLASACLAPQFFSLRLGKLMRQSPSAMLILAEKHFQSSLPLDVLIELHDRYRAGELSESQVNRLVPVLVRAFRDDDIELNADLAGSWLHTLVRHNHAGAIAALNEALTSDDWQQRQFAAHLLRYARPANVSDELLRVTIEGLRDDGTPSGYDATGKRWRPLIQNAWEGISFLKENAARARPMLVEGLDSDDWQQRQLCAIIIVRAKLKDLYPTVMPMLIESLANNDIPQDAWRSQNVLIEAGAEALPWLEQYRDAIDGQQRIRVRRIMETIDRKARGIPEPTCWWLDD